jgi:DNA-binding NtrC family response regulator
MTEKVLLVDDEVEFLEIMEERMVARGIEVSTSSSARDALDKIEKDIFDAVILDLQMPGMDGLETLKRIKERSPEIQVILLTGHATVEKGVEAIKLGAMDFVEKPADIEVLEEKITKAHKKKMLIVEKDSRERVINALKKYGF